MMIAGRLLMRPMMKLLDHEIASFLRRPVVRPVGQVEANGGGVVEHVTLAVGAGDRHAVEPRHVAGEIRKIEIAGLAARQHRDIGARHDLGDRRARW